MSVISHVLLSLEIRPKIFACLIMALVLPHSSSRQGCHIAVVGLNMFWVDRQRVKAVRGDESTYSCENLYDTEQPACVCNISCEAGCQADFLSVCLLLKAEDVLLPLNRV